MRTLIQSTAAYKIFSADRQGQKLSHAYLLRFDDAENTRAVLKLFASEFFGEERRVQNESLTDFTLYPQEDKKITVEGVSALIADSALKPVEGTKKLYAIAGFETASAIVQNKLLKTLEEPPEGVHFMLAARTLAPILPTVLSRVKLLDIPPFSEGQIFEALERIAPNPLNKEAAKNCGGSLGEAQNLLQGDKFTQILSAAKEICAVTRIKDIGPVSKKYGDFKYKEELVAAIKNIYFSRLGQDMSAHTPIYALECCAAAEADLKFNAYFQGLLYDFMLKVVRENDRWQKLQE